MNNNNKDINNEEEVKINNEEEVVKIKFWKKIFHTPLKYIVIGILTIIIMLLVLFRNGVKNVNSYTDLFFVPGFLWVLIGILSAIADDGFFRIFSYSGYYVVNKFKQKPIERYRTYSENKEKARDKYKYTYTPYLFCGCILLVISAIVLIIIRIFH